MISLLTFPVPAGRNILPNSRLIVRQTILPLVCQNLRLAFTFFKLLSAGKQSSKRITCSKQQTRSGFHFPRLSSFVRVYSAPRSIAGCLLTQLRAILIERKINEPLHSWFRGEDFIGGVAPGKAVFLYRWPLLLALHSGWIFLSLSLYIFFSLYVLILYRHFRSYTSKLQSPTGFKGEKWKVFRNCEETIPDISSIKL